MGLLSWLSGADEAASAVSTREPTEEEGCMKLSHVLKAQFAVAMAVLLLAGCSAMTGHQSPSAAVNDSAITTKVKSNLLADSMVGALAIDVDTTDGVVSLTGFVDNEKERLRAVQLAQAVTGVKRVDARNLVVKP
jgi:osmotically-inducible protein OsmY